MGKLAARRRQSFADYPAFVAPQPPSGRLINAILAHADVRQDLGGGRIVLRLSRERASRPTIRRSAGKQAHRLNDLALVWDEDAGQIVRVCDDADARLAAYEEPADPSELDTFELTEAALAYVARFS